MREKVDRDEADCRVQRPTNVSAYVFISEVVAQQMVQNPPRGMREKRLEKTERR